MPWYFTSLLLSYPQVGDRVGVIRLPEFNGSLAVYINGAPLGIIATNVSDNVYGFIELQGECERVGISQCRTIQQVRGARGKVPGNVGESIMLEP